MDYGCARIVAPESALWVDEHDRGFGADAEHAAILVQMWIKKQWDIFYPGTKCSDYDKSWLSWGSSCYPNLSAAHILVLFATGSGSSAPAGLGAAKVLIFASAARRGKQASSYFRHRN